MQILIFKQYLKMRKHKRKISNLQKEKIIIIASSDDLLCLS